MILRFCRRTTPRIIRLDIPMSQRRSARISAAAQKALQGEGTGVTDPEKSRAPRIGNTKATTKATKRQKKDEDSTDIGAGETPGGAAASTSTTTDFKVPSTPTSKRRKQTTQKQDSEAVPPSFPPLTPRRKPSEPDFSRPVDPRHSTATLVTPHGSHITAYPSTAEQASPSKLALPRPTTTTGNILEQGIAHLLKVEPRLRTVIDQYPSPPFGPADLAEEIDPFRSLTSGIIGQQVTGAAAKSIKNKFIALFRNDTPNKNNDNQAEFDYGSSSATRFPTPSEVAKCDIPTLRSAGLSQRKAEYIQGLAEKFAQGELSARMLLTANDDEVLAKLIAVRGLGQWSVEMFSCFGLKRMDVFSTGDLGVQRGMAAFAGKDVQKLKAKGGGKFKYMSEKDMLELAEPFSPYRSLFMWYMWRWEDVDVSAMQD